MNAKVIIKILNVIGSEYSKKWSQAEKKQKIETWRAVLEDVTDEQGMAGLVKLLSQPSEFPPPVGKFRQMCLSAHGCNSLEDEALLAWGLVINNLDGDSPVIFKDAAIAETIRQMGGWVKLSDVLTVDVPFRRKEFIELYVIVKSKEKHEDYTRMLPGRYESFKKFVGFDKGDDLKAVMAEIEFKKKNKDNFFEKLTKFTRSLPQ